MIVKINRDFYRVMSRNGKYIKRSRNVRLAGFSAAFLLAIYALLAAFPISYSSKDAEATIVPSETTLAIVSSKDTASVEITPTSGAGTFATSAAADKAEFTVTTDNLTGYSLNLVGSDTSGQLVNSTTGDTLDTLTADVAESTFRTGAASTYANRWGYQLNVNSITTTNFLAAPTSATKTIYATTGPNTTADSYTLGVGARVDYSKPEGTYTNTFVLTAVGNPIPYELNYLDNTGPGGTTGADVSGLPASEASANATVASFVLSSSEPTRSGYSFIGWCYGTVSHPASGASTCTGTVYQPGETFNFPNLSTTITNVANLYAMWNKPLIMQDFTTSMCAELASSSPIQVVDRRDGETYYVQQLADGNCWLLDNLRLDPTAVSLDDLKGNTNATDQILTYFKNGGGSSPYSSSGVSSAWTSSSQNSYNLPYIATTYKDTEAFVKYGLGSGKIGVYYNYCAASAGSYCYTSSSSSGNAQYDVCPSGWKMPTGDTAKGSYYYLFNTGYSGDATAISTGSFQYNLSASISGSFYSGSFLSQDTGQFWTSTRYNKSNMYNMGVVASVVEPRNNYNRSGGFSVRCIRNSSSTTITFNGNGADGGSMGTQVINATGSGNPSGTLNTNTFTRSGYYFTGWNTAADGSGTAYGNGATYTASTSGDTSVTLYAQWFGGSAIQDFTATTCASVASSSPVQVIDKRDGEIYYVQKLADGNCWLLDNLRLDPTAVSLDKLKGNTNATDQILTYFKNGGGSSPYPSSGVVAKTASGGSWTNSYNLPFVVTSGTENGGWTKDTVASTRYGSGGSGKIGVYYNYCAASAGSYCYAGGSGSGDTQYDICPSGWKMPAGDQNGNSYYYLYIKATNASQFKSALSIPLSGNFYSGSPREQGSYGHFWSSTHVNEYNMYNLTVSSSNISPQNTNDRGYGFSVRCIRNSSSTTITFNGNGADGGSMSSQNIGNVNSSGYPTGTLNANTFTRDGYYFAGWNTAADGSGTSYANRDIYTASTTGDTSVTLYAQWYNGVTMQDFTKSMCQSQASTGNINLPDVRDGNFYSVRYINGNCWMTQNLRFAGTTSDPHGVMTLDSTTSNVATTYTTSDPLTIEYGSLVGVGDDMNNPRIFVSNDDYINYGVYYNYPAVTAGTMVSYSTANAVYDICPKGWRLPTKSEIETIGNSTSTYTSAFMLAKSGSFSSGNLGQVGTEGYVWSSGSANGSVAWGLGIGTYDVLNSGYNMPKGRGYTSRCIRST